MSVPRPLLALGLLLALACGRSETPRLAVQVRLVDPEARLGARALPPERVIRNLTAYPSQTSEAAKLPRATIDDDTRHVLASFQQGVLAYLTPVEIARDGRVHAELPVHDAFAGADAVVVALHVRPAGRKDWHALDPTLARIESRPAGRVLVLDVAAGTEGAGGPAQLNAVALRPTGAETRYESAPVSIPAGARLELAFGVLPAAAAQGPVRFSLEACEGERCSSLLSEVLDPASPTGRVWNDRRLDLGALAGTTRTLRFRTEQLPGGGAFTLPVWGDPVLLAPAAAPDPRPNLILLSIDTLRRDHLDVYGYLRETAPFLREHLAGDGVVFDGLVAEATTTDPSHMTMLTSLPARVHGVTRSVLNTLAVPVTTLAEALRAQGYRTAAITEDGPLAHNRGFEIGFDAYRENGSSGWLLPAGRVEDTFRQARDWLGRNGDRPFFLFLHTFQVHAPYAPPAAYHALFDEAGPVGRTPAQRRTIVAYDREIRYVDDQLAELVRFADREGRARDTIWVVLSDHGEQFWEHGELGHGTLPYEEVLRVPLIVRGPGVAHGVRRAEVLHHLDLMPTLLELAGAPVPQQAQGRSFAALLRAGAPTDAWPTRPLASAGWILPAPFEAPALVLRLGTEKLMRLKAPGGWHEQSFDLASDPHEERPRADANPALRAALDANQRASETLRAALEASALGPEPGPVLLDPEREQTLRALGYIE
jgi:arylsulfatase A-like enzyme